MQLVSTRSFEIIVILRETFERIGNAGARKALEDVVPVSLESGVLAEPERRVNRQGVNVRQKITRLIHELNGFFAIGNSDVHMQTQR